MPSHEQVEEFFMEFAREMREQGYFIMDNYKNDWPNLLTEDQIRDKNVEEDYSTDENSCDED